MKVDGRNSHVFPGKDHNILAKREIIDSKVPAGRGHVSSLEGIDPPVVGKVADSLQYQGDLIASGETVRHFLCN